MKSKLLWIALPLSAALLAAADGQAKKPAKSEPATETAKPKTAKPQPVPAVTKPVEIPKDAVESEPGTYRYTDAQGKRWVYRKTPFGVARAEEHQMNAFTKTPENLDDV